MAVNGLRLSVAARGDTEKHANQGRFTQKTPQAAQTRTTPSTRGNQGRSNTRCGYNWRKAPHVFQMRKQRSPCGGPPPRRIFLTARGPSSKASRRNVHYFELYATATAGARGNDNKPLLMRLLVVAEIDVAKTRTYRRATCYNGPLNGVFGSFKGLEFGGLIFEFPQDDSASSNGGETRNFLPERET
jgi:hypothetical protein